MYGAVHAAIICIQLHESLNSPETITSYPISDLVRLNTIQTLEVQPQFVGTRYAALRLTMEEDNQTTDHIIIKLSA